MSIIVLKKVCLLYHFERLANKFEDLSNYSKTLNKRPVLVVSKCGSVNVANKEMNKKRGKFGTKGSSLWY